MAEREKLIGLLNGVQSYGRLRTETDHSITLALVENKTIADHLIANGVTIQQWIPVTERLPEPEVDVLAFNGDYVFVSQYYCSHFGSWDKEGHMAWVIEQYAKNPTHWMPLPEPPKEGQK